MTLEVFFNLNHRMAWVEKDHNAHLVLTPCYVQGDQPADQAAQSHIQPGFECPQGWGMLSPGAATAAGRPGRDAESWELPEGMGGTCETDCRDHGQLQRSAEQF